MSTIKATCPECGDVDLSPPDVKIYKYIGGVSVYTFLCPNKEHQELVSKPADEEVEKLLMSVRVEKIEVPRPVELDDTDRISIARKLGNLSEHEIPDLVLDLEMSPDVLSGQNAK